MEINYEDHALIKNYINTFLNDKNHFVELLFNYSICNNTEYIENNFSLNNLEILIKYFKNNFHGINGWRIISDKVNFEILDILYEYFNQIRQNGIIIYPIKKIEVNDLKIIKEYIYKFSKIKVKLVVSYSLNFDIIDIDNKLNDYENIFNFWEKSLRKIPNIIIDQNIKWEDKDYENIKRLVVFLIRKICFHFSYDKAKIYEFLLLNKDVDNISSPQRNDLLNIKYFDKINNNTLQCKIASTLTIDCNNLSFPTCCGFSHSAFNGGKFIINNNEIVDIEANDGINGFLSQRFLNIHFNLRCYNCENKYFCRRGCQVSQFYRSTEPFLPNDDLCKLYNSILISLINEFQKIELFDFIFSKKELDNRYKNELIKLLKVKGYPEYEYKYT